MADNSDILLKLVIKGMPPDEVRKLAEQTYGQLRASAAQQLDQLVDLHKQKQAAITAEDKKATDSRIKEKTKELAAVTSLMRAEEIEINKVNNAYARQMEHLENLTVVATGAWSVISGGFSRLKSAADEIIQVTNVYNSLTGSIEEMRVATQGGVSDIDLISAKNRALEKELELTDEQFGLVAGAADKYADAIGINTKEALDNLIDGMASGSAMALKKAGVMVDSAVAERKYADSIGSTVDALTEAEKKHAVQVEALEKMRLKLADAGDGSDKLADRMERGFVRITNAINGTLAAIGNLDAGDWEGGTLEEVQARAAKKIKSQQDAASAATHARVGDAYDADQAAFAAGAEADLSPQEQMNRFNDPFGTKALVAANRPKLAKKAKPANDNNKMDDNFLSKLEERNDQSTAYNSEVETQERSDKYDSDYGEFYAKDMEQRDAADIKRALVMAQVSAAHQGLEGVTVNESIAYAKLAEQLDINAEQLTQGQKLHAIELEAAVQTEEAMDRAAEKAKKYQDELNATGEKAGFLGYFLFGPDGPDQTYEQMDEMNRKVTDSFGAMSDMVAAAGKKMSDALAKSVVASITGSKQQAHALRQATHDILESMAEQAISQAIMQTAMGLGSLAMYNFPAAALHFAAAAAYGVLGAAAAVGAKAVGNPAANAEADKERADANKKASGGTSTSSGRSSDFGSGARDLPGGNDPGGPVTINMTVMPGGEAEAGRSVRRALDALENKEGAIYAKAS